MSLLQENQTKIAIKIAELTKEHGGKWGAITGFVAVTNVQFVSEGAVYNPTVGFPVKAFINESTGEVKLFDARQFINYG